jgi:Holliday junction resolvase RusA-like endonuclease
VTLPITVPTLTIDVPGIPRTQGSKRIGRTKTGRPIILDDNDRALREWRKRVASHAGAAVRLSDWLLAEDCALAVSINFWLARPASAAKRARPHVKPDIDKLARACLDAMTGVVYRDDARIVELVARKWYAKSTTGARIVVTTL